MSRQRLIHVIGAVVAAIGVSMLLSAGVSLVYTEYRTAAGIALAAVVTTLAGGAAWRIYPSPGELTTREGFAAVGLSWVAIAFFGSLVYLFTGAITDFTNAFFETASGFTTTGSSILADPGTLDHGVLFWRAFTQWLGGMGIIVLSIAILPLLGVGGVQLARAESPGVSPDRLTPRFRDTATRLWLVYAAFTAVEAVLLMFGDMNAFESVTHALTTLATGGFSTNAGSVGAYSAYSQWVVIVFMIIAGTSFALHYRALRDPAEYPRHPEFRLYFSILVIATLVIIVGTWGGDIATTIRDAVFVSVAMVTTTGFGTVDYGLWIPVLQLVVVGLMFIGGMSGSTSGSVKTYRLAVLVKSSRADLRKLVHTRGVFLTRFGKENVSDEIVRSVQAFFLAYMFIFMTGVVFLGMLDALAGSGLDITSTVTAVATAIGNVGPGLNEVGPTTTFVTVPAAGKWMLAGLMIVGRLEIFPILILFTRELWRR